MIPNAGDRHRSRMGKSATFLGSPGSSKARSAGEFDAVAESRKWKEAVAKETEGMTPEETVAYFERAAVRHRFEAALRQAERADKAQRQ